MAPNRKGRGGHHKPGDRGGPNGPGGNGHPRGRAAFKQQQNQQQHQHLSNHQNKFENHKRDRLHKPAKHNNTTTTSSPIQPLQQPFGAGATAASTYSTRQPQYQNPFAPVPIPNWGPTTTINRHAAGHHYHHNHRRPSFHNTCLSARTRISKHASLCERCTRHNRQLRDELLDLLTRNSRAVARWMEAAGVSFDHMDFERTRARTIHDDEVLLPNVPPAPPPRPPPHHLWNQPGGGGGEGVLGAQQQQQQQQQQHVLFADPFPTGPHQGLAPTPWADTVPFYPQSCAQQQQQQQPLPMYNKGPMMDYRTRPSLMSVDTRAPPPYSLPQTPPDSNQGPWRRRMAVESVLNKEDMGEAGGPGRGLGVILEEVSGCAIS